MSKWGLGIGGGGRRVYLRCRFRRLNGPRFETHQLAGFAPFRTSAPVASDGSGGWLPVIPDLLKSILSRGTCGGCFDLIPEDHYVAWLFHDVGHADRDGFWCGPYAGLR